jgi:predicted acyltransferase
VSSAVLLEKSESAPSLSPTRLASLDAFRGLAVLGMLLVNGKAFGPATWRQLTHAGLNDGIHLADLVFPWFLLIMGVAIPYAAHSRRAMAGGFGGYLRGVLRRTLILVLLGCLINSSYARRPTFDLGVLQLIGFAYLLAALAYELPRPFRLGLPPFLLVTYWVVLRFSATAGAGLEVLSVLPTAALALIGAALGDVLRAASPPRHQLRALAVTGFGLLLLGWLWHYDLPFSKPLWTPPYVVFAAGWGALLLATLYALVDLKPHPRWALPLVVAGRNAIVAFVAPLLMNLHLLREWHWTAAPGSPTLEEALKAMFFSHLGRVPGGFAYTCGYLLIWWGVLYWLFRRRIFLRV